MIKQSSPETLIGATVGRYRLEELIGQNELGPLFGARGIDQAQAPFLVRALPVPPTLSPEARAVYQDRFHQQASHIATLQHPYILPLVDYGIAQGMPYVVWPHVPVRPLSVRLAQSGPVDALTVGRYLDQIAGALEYTHERATIHRNLSTDCIYLQPDGRVVVADLGVRRMIELSAEDGRSYPVFGSTEACAPEQLAGGRVDTYTDVYALGAVLYRLLIGHPVFTGNTFEEIAQQHLNTPVPPLSLWHAGLPAGLDGLLATAMAKDPAQRFRQPGALANAYHDIVAPNRVARVPFISTGATGIESRQPPSFDPLASALQSGGPTMRADQLGTDVQGGFAPYLTNSPPLARRIRSLGGGGSMSLPLPRTRLRLGRSAVGRNALFVALTVLIVGATTFALTTLNGGLGGAPPTGSALFVDNPSGPPGHSDALKITVHGLGALPSGSYYDVWLTDTASEQFTSLGALTATNGSFTLNYPGDGKNGASGTNLLSLGNKLEISLEQGHVKLPVGKLVLAGAFPAQSFLHIQHLLVSFPTTPGHIGLLAGLLQQTSLMSAQAQVLQSVAASGNALAVQCTTRGIIDIIEGAHSPHYQPLPGQCAALNITQAGDGFGLVGTQGYLATASEHASNAAIAPDATSYIRLHAGHVETATSNIEGWLSTLEGDALTLLSNPTDKALVSEIVTLADHAYHGVDINGDEQIDPVLGEAGAVTAYEHGQLMAALTLTAVS